MRRIKVGVIVVVALVLATLLVRYVDSKRDAAPDPQAQPEIARFYEQTIDWSSCGANECGDLEVPLDYEDVGGETIEIALERVPATGDRLGSLAVNPGGPGESGTAFAADAREVFSPALVARYDIVGFDPRGVGRSTPIDCLVEADRTEFEVPGYSGRFWRMCEKRTGEILGHASTAEVARDLDILRSALGEDQLDYFGYSYGTQLGATYAELFPDQVGRFVLDGALDPNRGRLEETIDATAALQRGFEDFLRRCVARSCPVGDTVQEGESRVGRLLREAGRLPLPTTRGLPLDADAAFRGIWNALTYPQLWRRLETALGAAIVEHDGTSLAQLATIGFESAVARGVPGHPAGDEARAVIECLDDPWHVTLDGIPLEHFGVLERASRLFAPFRVGSLAQCDGLPFRPVPVALEYDAAGAPPIVVIGTTGDLATPYEWAVAMAEELSSGVLVTREGRGHTAYGKGNECIDGLVDTYLIDGTAPADGTVC